MPKVVVDLSETKGSRFELLPAGRYLCALVQSEEATSQAGNPMIVWDWKVLEPAEFNGQTIRTWTSLMKQAAFGFRDHLTALGEPVEDIESWSGDTDKFVGRRALLSVVVETRKGRDGNDRDFNSVTRLEPAPKAATSRKVRADSADVPY